MKQLFITLLIVVVAVIVLALLVREIGSGAPQFGVW